MNETDGINITFKRRIRRSYAIDRPIDLAHGAFVHGVGQDLAALREEDAGGFRRGAVGY